MALLTEILTLSPEEAEKFLADNPVGNPYPLPEVQAGYVTIARIDAIDKTAAPDGVSVLLTLHLSTSLGPEDWP